VAFPAGAQLRKILLSGMTIQVVQTDPAYTGIATVTFELNISFSSGANSGRQIYTTTRRIPCEMMNLYDPATLQRIYTSYGNAGDIELGVDYQCHWGKATDPAYNIRTGFDVVHNVVGGLNPNSSGQLSGSVKALYYL